MGIKEKEIIWEEGGDRKKQIRNGEQLELKEQLDLDLYEDREDGRNREKVG